MQPVRTLSIHEYLSLNLLQNAGIEIPKGKVATTPDEVFKIAQDLRKFSMQYLVIKI